MAYTCRPVSTGWTFKNLDMIAEFETKHKLDFEVADWVPIMGFLACNNFKRFRVGTCTGLWQSTETSYDILAVENEVKGNGHFEDVLQWFENSCERDHKDFRILEVWNSRLKKHLVKKRGFKVVGKSDNVIKLFI